MTGRRTLPWLLWVLPGVASASPAGGVLAGPTRASGASAWYNPAALAELGGHSAALIEVSGLAYDIGYQRQPEDPSREPTYERVDFGGVTADPYFTLTLGWPWPGLHLIAGGFSPVAVGSSWPEDGPQRYHATRAQLLSYTVGVGVIAHPHRRLAVAVLAGPAYYRAQRENALDFGAVANQQLPAGAALFAVEDPTLQGWADVNLDGWSTVVTAGIWAEPLERWRIGLGLSLPQDVYLAGDVKVSAPAAFAQLLPGYNFTPKGSVDLDYRMPWTVSSETSYAFGKDEVALFFDYSRKRRQRVMLGSISEAEPSFIEGRLVSVHAGHDDWSLGMRWSRRLDRSWEVGARCDWDPRYIPKEALNAGNLDFTRIEAALGASWQSASGYRVALTYGYVYLPSIEVDRSLYSPYAPAGSGFDVSSGRGVYDAWLHKLTVSVGFVSP